MAAILIGNWWALAIRGIAAIVFGSIAILWPGTTLLAIVFVFGIYALVDGILSLVAGLRAEHVHGRSAALIAEGIFDLVIAAICFLLPKEAGFTLVALIAIWAIASGVALIAAGLSLIRYSGEWLLVVAGTVSIVLGVVLFVQPATLAIALGICALLFGAAVLCASFGIRAHPI